MQFAAVGVLQGHTASVQNLAVSGTTLFSYARDNTIKQWDLTTGLGVLSITTEHTAFVMGLIVYDVYLFSAGLDGKVVGQCCDRVRSRVERRAHRVAARSGTRSPSTRATSRAARALTCTRNAPPPCLPTPHLGLLSDSDCLTPAACTRSVRHGRWLEDSAHTHRHRARPATLSGDRDRDWLRPCGQRAASRLVLRQRD
jgi:WD40 repeat protein